MKKVLTILLALSLFALSFTACGKKSDPANGSGASERSSGRPAADNQSAGGAYSREPSPLALQLREEYADTELYEYTDPLYNLPRDFRFVLKGDFFKQENWWYDLNQDEAVQIYASKFFESGTAVITDYEMDEDDGTLTVSPWAPAFDFEDAADTGFSIRMSGENDWGNASKYYLVRYIDFDTGEKLDKPLITLFTVKAELDAPQMKYRVDNEGRGVFYWEPVPGAESYIIGKVYVENGDSSRDSFELFDTVTGPEWRGFGDAVTWHRDTATGIDDPPEWYLDSANIQNLDLGNWDSFVLEDEGFCVFAVKEGGNSNMSNIVAYDEFAPLTPYKTDDSNDDSRSGDDGSLVMRYGSYSVMVASVDLLPIYQSIEMMDGSLKQYVIDYPETTDYVDTYTPYSFFDTPETYNRFITKTYGTLFMNGIVIEDTGGRSMEDILRVLNEREANAFKAAGGVVRQEFNINDTPSVVLDFGHNDSDVVIDTSETNYRSGAPDPDDIQIFDVYANSSLSAYIALCLLNHIEEIPLYDFPEAADGSVVADSFFEAYFQNNAYIGGVEWPTVQYDHATRTLEPEYVLTADEQRQLQREIDAKADSIAAQIITSGMSDYQKEEAINNYLCANAEYDYDALDDMMALPDNRAISDRYKYSQTAYGILINGKGICQSYAEAFRVLADKAGLPSLVIVGELNGMGGHAWNRVKIDGEWFTLDVTNNDNDEFYNEFFNMPDDIAIRFVTEWSLYAIDSELSQFTAASYGYDYFSQNGMSTSVYGLEDYLADNLASGKNFDVVVVDIMEASSADIVEALQNAANRAGVNYTPNIALWVLRVACD